MRNIVLESDDVEISYDPHGPMGLMLADTVPTEEPGPLDVLIDLEAYLMETHGMTLIQAIKKGVSK